MFGKKYTEIKENADGTISGKHSDAGLFDVVKAAIPGLSGDDQLAGTGKLVAQGLTVAASVALTSKYTTGSYMPRRPA